MHVLTACGTMTPGLAALSRAVSAAVTSSLEEEDLPEVLRPVLAEALSDPSLLPDSMAHDRPESGVGMHLLVAKPNFCIVATTMAPGRKLPVHDHSAWGVSGVYRGVHEQIRYEPSSQLLPGEPVLLEIGRLVQSTGDVIPVRPPPADIHAVVNGGFDWSVEVQVLSADPLALGFHYYLPPKYRPRHSGQLAYDSTPNEL